VAGGVNGGVIGAMAELADALEPLTDIFPGLQVGALFNGQPTPPAIDVYPGEDFQLGAGFDVGSVQWFFTVRAQVQVTDPVAGQTLLLRLMDPTDPGSLEAAIVNADAGTVVGVSAFREYPSATGDARLVGTEWRVSVFA